MFKIGNKIGFKHGFCGTKEYRAWLNMKKRCLNKNHKEYKNYGGRGIKICKKWEKSFEAFYKDVGKKPSKIHSLDRINNKKGYYPNNCRWALPHEQSINTRKQVNKTVGIFYDKKRNKFQSVIWSKMRRIHLGRFNTLEEAIKIRKKAEKLYWNK